MIDNDDSSDTIENGKTKRLRNKYMAKRGGISEEIRSGGVKYIDPLSGEREQRKYKLSQLKKFLDDWL